MRIYFDHNATAPLDEQVREAMAPFERGSYGNPASRHAEGRSNFDAVENARAQVAAAVNARSDEVVFTSCGTESNNTIIKGVAQCSKRKVVATSAVEHPCVHCSARAVVRNNGCTFAPVGVDGQGLLDFDDLASILATDEVALVSVMLANNESGVIQDVARAAMLAKESGAVMHTDAAQALGKIPVDFEGLGVDAMTISGHKARGPMGSAALVVKSGVDFEPLLEGGGQERGLRSGTLNVPAIVGLGKAAELAARRVDAEHARLARLQGLLEAQLVAQGAVIFSQGAMRLPNTSYFGFDGIEGETLVVMLDQNGFAVTSGAACASTKNEPSHVLLAMELAETVARTAVRCSLGLESDEEQVREFAAITGKIVAQLRKMAAVAG